MQWNVGQALCNIEKKKQLGSALASWWGGGTVLKTVPVSQVTRDTDMVASLMTIIGGRCNVDLKSPVSKRMEKTKYRGGGKNSTRW